MKVKLLLLACAVLLTAIGCDTSQRITNLEKQISKRDIVADYDLQAKCAKDAKTWFRENWRDVVASTSILLDYTNHYNKAMNKCFIVVEYHYTFDKDIGNWTNNVTLWDVYENVKIAEFNESHSIEYKPTTATVDRVVTCEVAGTKCTALQQFNNLCRPYMNN